MLRLLHLADLHLGWFPSYLPQDKQLERQKERDQLLEKAVDFALDPVNNIHLVFFVGDLFETHQPAPALVEKTIKQIKRLTEADIFVLTVPGNHDEITYYNSVFRGYQDRWPGQLVTNPRPAHILSTNIKGQKVHIYSLAYTGGITPLRNLAPFPRLDEEGLHLGAFHGQLDAVSGDRSLPLRSEDLAPAGYNYVALGHIHQHQQTSVGDGLAVYPGQIEHKTLDDPGEEHLTVVSFKEPIPEIEKIKIDVRPHLHYPVEVSALDNLDECIEQCRKFANPAKIVRFVLKGTSAFPIDKQKLESSLEDDFFYVEIKDETTAINPRIIDTIKEEPTVRGQFVKNMQERIADADTSEKSILQMALIKGLTAFRGGER